MTSFTILESKEFEEHRKLLKEYYGFHDEFWAINNRRFQKERSEFISLHEINPKDENSPERLATFHRQYLTRYQAEFRFYQKGSYLWSFRMLKHDYQRLGRQMLSALKHLRRLADVPLLSINNQST